MAPDPKRFAFLCAGYALFLGALPLAYWTMYALLNGPSTTSVQETATPVRPYCGAGLADDENRTRSNCSVCLPEECTTGNPLLFLGLDLDLPEADNGEGAEGYLSQQKALSTLGGLLADASRDDSQQLVNLYVRFSTRPNETTDALSPGACSVNDVTDEIAGALQHSLVFTFVQRPSTYMIAQYGAFKSWMSFGLLDLLASDYPRSHPLQISVGPDAADMDCWDRASVIQRKAMLHYKVAGIANDLIAYARNLTTAADHLPGVLLVRQPDTEARQHHAGAWFLPFAMPKGGHLYTLCQQYNPSAIGSVDLPQVECKNNNSEFSRCLDWEMIADRTPMSVQALPVHLHYLWIWLLVVFVLPALHMHLAEGAVGLCSRDAKPKVARITTGFQSLRLLSSTMPLRSNLRCSFPAQLAPWRVVLRRPTTADDDCGETRETWWHAMIVLLLLALLVVAYFILALPVLLQSTHSPFYHIYDSLPTDCGHMSTRGLAAAALVLGPILTLFALISCYLVATGNKPQGRQLVRDEIQRATGLAGAHVRQYAMLLPTLPETMLGQIFDKCFLFYAYRSVLVCTQSMHEVIPAEARLLLIFLGSYCFGLSALGLVYFASQYAMMAVATLTAALHMYFLRTVLALLLLRVLVWRAAWPRHDYTTLFPDVSRCHKALVEAVCRLEVGEVEDVFGQQQPSQENSRDDTELENGHGNPITPEPHATQLSLDELRELVSGAATKTFLRVYFLATTGEESPRLSDNDAQVAYETLLCDIQRQAQSWVQRVVLSVLLALALFLLLDDAMFVLRQTVQLTLQQKIGTLLGVWIGCLLLSHLDNTPQVPDTNSRQLLATAHRFLLEQIAPVPAEGDATPAGPLRPFAGSTRTSQTDLHDARRRGQTPSEALRHPSGLINSTRRPTRRGHHPSSGLFEQL
eukprot:scpid27872/ scgid20308/ 